MEEKNSREQQTRNAPEELANQNAKENFREEFSDQEKKQEEIFLKNLGDKVKYIDMLRDTPYDLTHKGFTCINKEGEMEIISNALIIAVKQYELKREDETDSDIEIIAITTPEGEVLPNIKVNIKQIDSGNWITNSSWGLKVIFELPIQKGKQIKCMKDLGKNIEKETIYQYIGFSDIEGVMTFLHTGGAIGIDKDIKVDLGDENLNRFTLTKKEFDIKDTLKKTLECEDVAPKRISLPILALTFMSVLTSLFKEVGIALGFLTWVQGPQHCLKTSMVSAIASHFGFFDKNHTPMSFLDGIPSAKEKASKLKECLCICDDYFPSANKQEAQDMKKFAEMLISLSADGMSGSRSKSNGEMRKTNRAKGQIIVTGEMFPDLSQSRMSRVLFINVKEGDIRSKELKNIQTHQEELQYTMKEFIKYEIKNMEKFKADIKTIFDQKVEEARTKVISRTADMLTGLYIGYSMLMEFALVNDVITAEQKEEMLEEAWDILIQLGEEQNKLVENNSPIQMFLSAVELLTNAERLTVFDYTDATTRTLKEIMTTGFIGFYDRSENVNYVYPDKLYIAVKKFYNEQGVTFPWNQTTMCKELFNQGYLYKTPKQERPQVRRKNPITQREESFIGLLQDKVYIACRYLERGIILTK